jgi:hypothetical protein
MSPGAGEVIRRARVAADLPAHIPPAPRTGPTRIVMTTTSKVVVMRPMMVRPSLCARSNQTKHCHCSHGSTDHGSSLLRGRSRLAIKKPLMGGHTKCQAAWFEGADYIPLLARLRNRPWLKWGISQPATNGKLLLSYAWLRQISAAERSLSLIIQFFHLTKSPQRLAAPWK